MRLARRDLSADAPPGRYRVEEKDGRLVVVDNGTGARLSPTVGAPPFARGRTAGPPAPERALDVAARIAVRLAVRQWDSEGRAVIAWKWTQNGKPVRWDAVLDSGQQRRLGRALVALGFVPVAVFASFPTGLPFLGFLAAFALIVRGAWGLNRLRSETNTSPD